jgi:oligoribonuclease (3'-5' exoribonuclease)
MYIFVLFLVCTSLVQGVSFILMKSRATQFRLTTVIGVMLMVAFFVTTTDASTARRGKVTKHQRHEHYRDHVVDMLPNVEDHNVMRELRCSACKELSGQLYASLLEIYRSKDPSHSELVDVIDNMCQHHVNMYGLLPDTQDRSKASTVFSRDSNQDLIHGLWINKFVKDRCSQLMVRHEEAIIEKHPEADSLSHFQEMVCVDWDASCDAGRSVQMKTAEAHATISKPLSKGSFSRSLRSDEM